MSATPITAAPSAGMVASDEAAQAVREIDALLDQVVAIANHLPERDSRLQVLTHLARRLCSTKPSPVRDPDGRLISAGAPIAAQVNRIRRAAFEQANRSSDGGDRLTYDGIARLTGMTRSGVQQAMERPVTRRRPPQAEPGAA